MTDYRIKKEGGNMLEQSNPEIYTSMQKEANRQKNGLEMIPSENYVSDSVLAAMGSILTNKYSEGYPGKRYYQGNEIVDEIENLAIGRAKKLFKIPYANVQPYSGSPANSEVLFALCKPGETIMGMQLSAGGHLTHGHPDVTFSGTFFRSIQFGLDEKQKFNFTRIRQMAKKEKPSMMFVGTTAYPMKLDWKAFSEIADELNDWRNIVAHQYISKLGHSFSYDYSISAGYRIENGIIILNPTIFFEQFQSAFLLWFNT